MARTILPTDEELSVLMADPDTIFWSDRDMLDELERRGIKRSTRWGQSMRACGQGPAYVRPTLIEVRYLHHRDPGRSPFERWFAAFMGPARTSTADEARSRASAAHGVEGLRHDR